MVLQRSAELQTRDEERRKLSRDLHDSTGQTLAALKISVSLLQEQCKQNPSTVRLVSEVIDLADGALAIVRYNDLSVEYARGFSKCHVIRHSMEVGVVFGLLLPDCLEQEGFPFHLHVQGSHFPVTW